MDIEGGVLIESRRLAPDFRGFRSDWGGGTRAESRDGAAKGQGSGAVMKRESSLLQARGFLRQERITQFYA